MLRMAEQVAQFKRLERRCKRQHDLEHEPARDKLLKPSRH